MANTLFKTLNLTALAAVFMLGAGAAQAQSAYTGDSGHYLTVPQGQQTAQQSSSGRPLFTGQGMGQGQLQQAAAPATPMQQPVASSTQASSRMLPQGYAPQASTSTQTTVMQPNPVAFPMAKPMAQPVTQSATIQAASIPSAQVLASMEPAAGAFSPSTNVGLATGCDGRADNHRQHKGINTSTTVGNSCFN